MFGHQDDQSYQNDNNTENLMPEPPHDGFLGDDQQNNETADTPSPFNPALPPADAQPTLAAGAPSMGDDSAHSTDTPANDSTNASSTDTNTLLDIKQQALQQLSPLVGHLEQSPEEKFRTTMMMIQASDDQSLIKTAYEAAQAISDEKTKAQALLDIVNEINYFTHQQNHED
ncbi:MAG TPA: hypothetical protein VFN56_02515 [Candidatus Saccharimonadales bacterium]|nr:hypothetical protein [Candidatus Saccharimonadales bacterium]